ncbi:hypothetical protein CWM47_24165 [Spirosoma pollinicola]|uniref:WYL domain-containing protein n=1 Tax=Spirosoma pollinicola TaxID=2057025 RepID=A0A2K8Z479_9BACT|nr:hypothetical protein CWM47_24165 [Spirosoma pollinicola]
MDGTQFAHTIQRLIQHHQIRQICIYRLDPLKLYDQQREWSFGHEFIQVGPYSYNLNRVRTYRIAENRLFLYF